MTDKELSVFQHGERVEAVIRLDDGDIVTVEGSFLRHQRYFNPDEPVEEQRGYCLESVYYIGDRCETRSHYYTADKFVSVKRKKPLFAEHYRGICIDKGLSNSNGKKIFGEWRYGDFRRLGCGAFIGVADMYRTIVCPDTVCRYTGFTDKNDCPIFENDIVKIIIFDTSEEQFMIVKFGEFYDVNANDWFLGFYFELREGCVSFLHYRGKYISILEVVGNVFKNRELLKKVYEGQ